MNTIANQRAITQSPVGLNWRPNLNQTGRTFADARINNFDFRPYGGYNWQPPMGYGLDLNNDGKFDPNKDGFLSFDLNRDGRHTDQEIQQSRNLLKAFSGDFDVNADGRVDYGEYFQGYQNFFQARSMDIDRDGVLSKWELQKAGGAVLQRNNNTHQPDVRSLNRRGFAPVQKWNTFGLDNLPNGRRLEYLNPWRGTFETSPNIRFFSDFPNGGNITNELPKANSAQV